MQEEIRNLWLYQTYDVFKQYNTGIKLDYIILLITLALCTVLTGISLSSVKKKYYWLNSLPLIIVFTLIEGLRYLRGTDYLNYALLYKYHGEGLSIEIVYNTLQAFFYFLNLPYWGIFIVYALIWIIALLYLFKKNKKYILYGLPIFILLGLGNFECFIRQNIAFAVIFIFLAFLFEHNYKKAFISAIIAFLTHSSSIIFIFYILVIYWISQRKKCVSPSITMGLYFLFTFILDSKTMGGISEIIKLIPVIDGTAISVYIENADRWFGADATNEIYARSFTTKLGTLIFDILIIYWSYKNIRTEKFKNIKIIFIYNLFSISLIILQAFFIYEIPRRFFNSFYMFASFLIANLFINHPSSKKESLSRYIIVIYLIVYFIKNILMTKNQLFIWDAEGVYDFHL